MYIQKKSVMKYEDLESLIDNYPGAMALSDMDGKILAINENLARVFNKPRNNLLGENGYNYIEKKVGERRKKIIEKITKTKKFEILVDAERGRWWKSIFVPILDEKSTVKQMAFYIEDITGEKEQELKIIEGKEDYYKSLIENSIDLIALISSDRTFLYQSPSLQRILGYLPNERVKGNIMDNVHPEDIKKLTSTFDEILSNPTYQGYLHFRVRHKNGEYRLFESTVNNQINNPIVQGIIVNARDITDREKLERETKERKQYLESLMDGTTEIIFTIDETYTIGIWNKAAETLTGFKRVVIQGKKLDTISVFSDIPEITAFIDSCFNGKPAVLSKILINTKNDMKRLLRFSSSVVRRESMPDELVFVCNDITFMDEVHGDLIAGFSYLISEPLVESAKNLFRSLLRQGWHGYYITRADEKIEEYFHDFLPKVGFISLESSEKDVIRNSYELYKNISDFLRTNARSVILLDRIDYLISFYGFHEVLKNLYHINDLVSQKKALLLLRVNKLLFNTEQYTYLQEEFNRLPSKELADVYLNDEIYNILQFIAVQNKKNTLVSQKGICSNFTITKVTAQKRIEKLLADGFIISKKQGRSKYLYATDRAFELFEKRSNS